MKSLEVPSIGNVEMQDMSRYRALNAMLRTRYHVPQETVITERPIRGQVVGPLFPRKHYKVTNSKKKSVLVGAERSTDSATSFAGLLTRVAPNTQSLCFTVTGYGFSLITSPL